MEGFFYFLAVFFQKIIEKIKKNPIFCKLFLKKVLIFPKIYTIIYAWEKVGQNASVVQICVKQFPKSNLNFILCKGGSTDMAFLGSCSYSIDTKKRVAPKVCKDNPFAVNL